MRAAVFKRAGVLELEEVPTPRAQAGEVVLKIACCAICGSDLHKYAHGLMAPGVIMGHEAVGTIVGLGEGVTGWSLGERVVRAYRGPLPPRYASRDKGFTVDLQFPGAFAEYLAWPAHGLLRLPAQLSDQEASLTEPLSIAVHAVRLSQVKLGAAVAILGAGPIGLLALQTLRSSGAGLIVVSEPREARRELARSLGADVVLDPREADVVAEVVRLTAGLGADVAFECAGGAATLEQGLELVRSRGQVVLVALSLQPVAVSPLDWVGREVQLQCSYGAERLDWQLALDSLAAGRVQGRPLVSKVMPLAAIQAAFQESLRPDGPLQVVIEP